jgi:small ligand-binding sensory domain FIST
VRDTLWNGRHGPWIAVLLLPVGLGMAAPPRASFSREIEAVRAAFPGVPVAGFLTYGEIARFKGHMDGWHNTTAVVAAIPA